MRKVSYPLARDRMVTTGLLTAAILSSCIVGGIIAFVAYEAVPAFSLPGWQAFFSTDIWDPTAARYGMARMIAATLVISALALLLAWPCGIAVALYGFHWLPPGAASCLRTALALLAGIPSVVFGLWGLVALVPLLQSSTGSAYGQGVLAATMVLALMIFPTVAITADASLRAIPQHQLQAAAALGFSRTGTALHVLLPAASRGLITGGLLALARGLGETMAVLMVSGKGGAWPDGAFASVTPMTATIAMEMGYAGSTHRHCLYAIGLVLLLLVLGLVGWSSWRWRDQPGTAT